MTAPALAVRAFLCVLLLLLALRVSQHQGSGAVAEASAGGGAVSTKGGPDPVSLPAANHATAHPAGEHNGGSDSEQRVASQWSQEQQPWVLSAVLPAALEQSLKVRTGSEP
jgi:hypothetical protein